jgi:hypothetical protein
MLPDWPNIKRDIVRAMMRRVRAEIGARSTIGLVPKSSVHEGHATMMIRADGTSEASPFETSEGEFALPMEALKEENLEQLFARMRPLIESQAKARTESMLRTVEAASRAAGTASDAKGRPITAELILEAWEKLDIEFMPNGMPRWPQMVFHPSQQDRVDAELTRLQTVPELRERMQALLARKREDWRAREADRTLAG